MDTEVSPSNSKERPTPERRVSARHQVALSATVTRGTEVDGDYVDDIGSNGARIRGCSGIPLVVGAHVRLRFVLPQLAEPVGIEATVRWVAAGDVASGGVCFERGLRGREAWALSQLSRESPVR